MNSRNQKRVNGKALLYVRVSSEEQERNGFSLDAQEKLGREYASRNGLTIVKFWKVAESAWRRDRRAFQSLIDFAQRHADVEHIIFDVLDRMTRNDFDKMKIVRLIKEHGKSIHFSRSNKVINNESGSEEEFMFDIEVAVAKKMSKDISRKASMGMQEKANQGNFAGTAPLGYRNNKQTKQIEIDQERSHYIKRAFELKASGNYSIQALADRLYKDGLRTKKGNQVRKSAMSLLLNNPIYYGSFNWKGQLHEGKHKPIISKDLFDRVQDMFSSKGNRAKLTKHNFPFQGVARCGICNCTILGELKKSKYIYYHCGFSKGRHDSDYISAKEMPSLFADIVRKVTITDEIANWLTEAIAFHQSKESNYRRERRAGLAKEQGRLQSRLSILYDKLLDDELDTDMLRFKERELRERLSTTKSELQLLEVSCGEAVQHAQRLLELCKRLYDVYLSVDDQNKAKLLRVLGSNYILIGRSVCVTYNKPFNFLANLPSRTEKLPR